LAWLFSTWHSFKQFKRSIKGEIIMFGILEKMDRFSNKLMTNTEKVSFIQEIVDSGLVWDMHDKYVYAALTLIGRGEVNASLPLGCFGSMPDVAMGQLESEFDPTLV
jgi:hypothetical protein